MIPALETAGIVLAVWSAVMVATVLTTACFFSIVGYAVNPEERT